MLWQIENSGEAPVECLTLLGLSTARGDETKIGQFGTGCKHSINILLRAGITPVIFSGLKKIEFYAQPQKIEGTNKFYNRIYYSVDGVQFETSMTLEFGEIDWTNIHMAIREFVSNAIDSGDPAFCKTDRMEGIAGKTRVYLQETPEINKYFMDIGSYFLLFSNREDKDQKIMAKTKDGPPTLYRKGVFVRQIEKSDNSLFDYNLSSLKIDECRNLDDWSANYQIAKTVAADEKAIRKILLLLGSGKSDFYEAQKLSASTLKYGNVDLKKIWEELFPDMVICIPAWVNAVPKGSDFDKIKMINSESWAKALMDSKVKSVLDLFEEKITPEGDEIVKPSKDTIKVLKHVWGQLDSINMTNGKAMPKVFNFRQVVTKKGIILGYQKDGSIYINVEVQSSKETIFEELVHYISGAGDCTREYQEFVNSVVSRMMTRRKKITIKDI